MGGGFGRKVPTTHSGMNADVGQGTEPPLRRWRSSQLLWWLAWALGPLASREAPGQQRRRTPSRPPPWRRPLPLRQRLQSFPSPSPSKHSGHADPDAANAGTRLSGGERVALRPQPFWRETRRHRTLRLRRRRPLRSRAFLGRRHHTQLLQQQEWSKHLGKRANFDRDPAGLPARERAADLRVASTILCATAVEDIDLLHALREYARVLGPIDTLVCPRSC